MLSKRKNYALFYNSSGWSMLSLLDEERIIIIIAIK